MGKSGNLEKLENRKNKEKHAQNNLKISGKEKNIRKIRKTLKKRENQKQKRTFFSFFNFQNLWKMSFFYIPQKRLSQARNVQLKVYVSILLGICFEIGF